MGGVKEKQDKGDDGKDRKGEGGYERTHIPGKERLFSVLHTRARTPTRTRTLTLNHTHTHAHVFTNPLTHSLTQLHKQI